MKNLKLKISFEPQDENGNPVEYRFGKKSIQLVGLTAKEGDIVFFQDLIDWIAEGLREIHARKDFYRKFGWMPELNIGEVVFVSDGKTYIEPNAFPMPAQIFTHPPME